MGLWSLFVVASSPNVQVLLIGLVGAFLATDYANILTASARKDMNKIVYYVFTPSLMFASLAKTVTLQQIVSWWFMPVNIGIIFLIGSLIGWIAVKTLRPPRYLEGIVIASCSAGNLGNLLLIIIPAVCDEDGNPFGDHEVCRVRGLAYVSFSMALGGFYIWTHTFSLMKKAGKIYHYMQLSGSLESHNKDSDTKVAKEENLEASTGSILPLSAKPEDETAECQLELPLISSSNLLGEKLTFWGRLKKNAHQIVEELMSPPTISAVIGFIFGATPWLKSLVIGDHAVLKVIQDAIKLLGDGTVPCITLILGGNLTRGLRKPEIRKTIILAIICVRYVILPACGIAIVKAAYEVGFLPEDPLYRYILMIQFTLPPAMNIGTMAQLFDVAQEECSVIFLWTYLVAAIALTVWSTIFMSIVS